MAKTPELLNKLLNGTLCHSCAETRRPKTENKKRENESQSNKKVHYKNETLLHESIFISSREILYA